MKAFVPLLLPSLALAAPPSAGSRRPQRIASLLVPMDPTAEASGPRMETVKSRPAGARVYIDNELIGYTPVTVQTLSVGKHLLRLERPGFQVYGQLLEVSPDDVEASAALRPTDGYKAYEARLDTVATEVMRPNSTSSQAVAALGKALGLERGLVGTVRNIPDSGTTELVLGLFDMGTGKRLGVRRVVLQGDEPGQLEPEMGRLVNHLNGTGDW